MSVRGGVSCAVRAADRLLSRAYLGLRGDPPGLICFFLHGLYADGDAAARDVLYFDQAFTVGQFRRLVGHFKQRGYRFVSPQQIAHGLDPAGRYALLTFDDGYYNNRLALPVLCEFEAPAVFYVCSGRVRSGRAYWWDVVFRNRMKARMPIPELAAEVSRLEATPSDEVDQYIQRQFGPEALRPLGDADRPFAPAELKEFSREPYVVLGNHTADHAILTNYDTAGIRKQIETCQQDLLDMTGTAPLSIAYPNGRYTADAVEISRSVGLKLGFTTQLRRNALPVEPGSAAALQLGRFALKHDGDIEEQCEACRSPLSLYRGIQRTLQWMRPAPRDMRNAK